jgi:predicted dehydrogenase
MTRLIVIGAGANVWNLHRPGVEAIGAEVVAVHDADPVKAGKVAAELDCPAASTVDELLAFDADAAVILTPHPTHAELAVRCLRAGRHVLVEKPLAVTPSEGDRMCFEASATGRILAVAFQLRTRTEVIKARELVRNGELGELHRIDLIASWPRRTSYFATAPWRGTWRGEGGGIVINQGQHELDLLCHLVGLPAAVTAYHRTARHPIETEDTSFALAEWPNGAGGTLSLTTAAVDEPERIELTGSAGRLRLRPGRLRFWRNHKDFHEYAAEPGDPYQPPDVAPPEDFPGGAGTHTEIYRNLHAAINGTEPPTAPAADAARALELAAALILSARTARRITLPVNRPEYDRLLAQDL